MADGDQCIIRPGTVTQEVRRFTEEILKVANTHFNKSKDTVKGKYNKYWWNEHSANASRLRERAKTKMENHLTQTNILEYRRLHAAAIAIHKFSKRQAWRKYSSQITQKTTPKQVWKIIKSFTGTYGIAKLSTSE